MIEKKKKNNSDNVVCCYFVINLYFLFYVYDLFVINFFCFILGDGCEWLFN